jgi:hypothetical protein
MLPGNVMGIPSHFEYHGFCFTDCKEQAHVRKQAAQRLAECTRDAQKHFYVDYRFMQASMLYYQCPNKVSGRVITSFDGLTLYLLIVDEASCHMWVFLTSHKDLSLDLIDKFPTRFGHPDGGLIRPDKGKEFAGSQKPVDMVLWQYNYVVETSGEDSPSQNGAMEIYNNKLALCTCTLLYDAGLLAKYWSAELLHAMYLNNHLVLSVTQRTPFEGFYR